MNYHRLSVNSHVTSGTFVDASDEAANEAPLEELLKGFCP
jgi:hypothetical protein